MRILFCAILAISLPAAADVISEEVAACRNLSAGATCTTRGLAGTCVETSVSRPDYSTGIPPKYKTVKTLTCVATAKGTAFSATWIGIGLSFLAMLMGFLFRPRPPGVPA